MERAAVEDAIDRPHQGTPVGGDRGHGQEPHPVEAIDQLGGADPAIRRDDAAQVGAGPFVTAVEEILEGGDFSGCLVDPEI
jgi:hypothetical protein